MMKKFKTSLHITRNFLTTMHPTNFCFEISVYMHNYYDDVWYCRPIMIISVNFISLIGGRKVNQLLMSNIYSYKLGMSNQTRYAETV